MQNISQSTCPDHGGKYKFPALLTLPSCRVGRVFCCLRTGVEVHVAYLVSMDQEWKNGSGSVLCHIFLWCLAGIG